MRVAPLTVIIPTAGASSHIDGLLDDLSRQTTPPEHVVIAVNNRRSDREFATRSRIPQLTTLPLTRRHFFCRGVNAALECVGTDYVAVANDDVRLDETWCETAIDVLHRHPEHGSLASRLLSLSHPGHLDSAGDVLHVDGRATNRGWRQAAAGRYLDREEVFSASGALALYRTDALKAIGGFDPALKAYFEDIDVGFRLQLLGRPCLYEPKALAYHVGGATRRGWVSAAKLVERNMVINVIKNFPRPILNDVWHRIARQQMRPSQFESKGSPAAWTLGKLMVLRHLRSSFRERARIQAARRVSVAYVRSILSDEEPAVVHL